MFEGTVDARDEPDEDDWPIKSKLRDFNELEKILSCGICKSFLTNPKELPCGHLYCAECISRSMDNMLWNGAKNECPTCRTKAVQGQCKANVNIGKVVTIFKGLRKDLLELMERDAKGGSDTRNVAIADSPAKPASTSKPSRGRPRKVIQEEQSDDEAVSSSSSASVSKKGKVIGKSITFYSFGNKPQMKKIREQLAKVCTGSRSSLRMDGDEKKLINRYRNFVHLHNAQVDGGDTALTLDEVVRKCNEDESTAERESRATRPTAVALKMTGDDGFRNLVIAEKERMKKLAASKDEDKTSSAPASTLASTSSSARTSPKEDKENDDTQLGSISGRDNDNAIKDSNSNPSTESPPKERRVGRWNVLWSKKFSVPFFFDLSTSRGQMEVPNEFKDFFTDVHSEQSMMDALALASSSSTKGKADSPVDLTSDVQEASNSYEEPSKWECSMCTYHNDINKAVCEMCQAKCPLQTKRTRSQKAIGGTQTTVVLESSKKARRL